MFHYIIRLIFDPKFVRLVDIFAFTAVGYFANNLAIEHRIFTDHSAMYIIPLSAVIFSYSMDKSSAYNNWPAIRISHDIADITKSLLIALAFVLMSFEGFKIESNASRIGLLVWFFFSLLTIASYHWLFNFLSRISIVSKHIKKSVIVLHDTQNLNRAYQLAAETRSRNAEMIDFIDINHIDNAKFINSNGMFQPRDIEIWILVGQDAVYNHTQFIFKLFEMGYGLLLFIDSTAINLYCSRLHEKDGSQYIHFSNCPISPTGQLIKRIFDILFSTALLAFLSPLFLICIIAIKTTSKGSIFFLQERIGFKMRPFTVYKFRTMSDHSNAKHVKQAMRNDDRVTSVGRFLRRYSLDELPQLFNVLLGNMSIVGPRPHATIHNDQYKEVVDNYLLRHLVMPGITGWAQINGLRGATETIEKMQSRVNHDVYYINNWSIGFDIKIIIITAVKVIFDKDAY